MNFQFIVIIFALFSIVQQNIYAAVKTAPMGTNANWGSVAWSPSAPACGDEIVINGTVRINTDVSFPGCTTPMKITINGTLDFTNNGRQLYLPANSIIIINTGGRILASGSGGGASNFINVGTIRVWSPGGGSALYSGNPFTGPFSYPTVLGVKFENIYVTNQHNLALVKWEVSEQVNNSFFIVEKSINAQDWKIVSSINGDGTLKESKTFSYLDFETISNIQYYRIKQVDYNGDFKYSEIASISALKPLETKIYPNPAQDFVYIETSVMDQNVSISNEMGENMKEQVIITAIDPFHYKLDVTQLRSGAYIIKLNNAYLKLYKQ